MAELTLTAFMTLDGVVQGPGAPTEDPSGGIYSRRLARAPFRRRYRAAMDEIFAKADAFLLGRTTYDLMAAYWPQVTDPGDLGAVKLNSLPKFVASRTRTTFSWNGSSHVRDVVRDVPDIKQRFAGEVQVHGSCGLAQTLIKHDLIDEYRLLVFPVILGAGKRLFGSGAVPSTLTLARSSITGSGVVVSVYRRTGEFKTGALEMPAADN